MSKARNIPATPKERQRQLVKLKYLMQVQGLSQKQAAAVLQISPSTVSRIVNSTGLARNAEKQAANALNRPVSYDDSLSAFIARVRLKNGPAWPIVETLYKQFLNER